MLIKYFERHFENEEILKRGKFLYDTDCVTYLYKIKEELFFTVQSSKTYLVTIKINENFDNVSNWSCNCPYAKKDLCKHFAACLYFIRNKMNKNFYN